MSSQDGAQKIIIISGKPENEGIPGAAARVYTEDFAGLTVVLEADRDAQVEKAPAPLRARIRAGDRNRVVFTTKAAEAKAKIEATQTTVISPTTIPAAPEVQTQPLAPAQQGKQWADQVWQNLRLKPK